MCPCFLTPLFWHDVKMLPFCSRSQITVGVSWFSVESVVSTSLPAQSKSLNVASERIVSERPFPWTKAGREVIYFCFSVLCFVLSLTQLHRTPASNYLYFSNKWSEIPLSQHESAIIKAEWNNIFLKEWNTILRQKAKYYISSNQPALQQRFANRARWFFGGIGPYCGAEYSCIIPGGAAGNIVPGEVPPDCTCCSIFFC